MGDKTVILTTVNEAWAANNSLLDLFLESFRIGNNTQRLLNHLVIITLDPKAYTRCITLHPHCYALKTKEMDFSKEAFFMSHDYLEMMWRRIDFLRSVLKMRYNFIFTVLLLFLPLLIFLHRFLKGEGFTLHVGLQIFNVLGHMQLFFFFFFPSNTFTVQRPIF